MQLIRKGSRTMAGAWWPKWERPDDPDPTCAGMSCPQCGAETLLRRIGVDGTVADRISCETPACGWQSYVKLDGWAGDVRS